MTGLSLGGEGMFWCQSLYEGHDTEAKAPAHRMCKISTKHHLNGHGDEQTSTAFTLDFGKSLFLSDLFIHVRSCVVDKYCYGLVSIPHRLVCLSPQSLACLRDRV